jgi:hypothetical protein
MDRLGKIQSRKFKDKCLAAKDDDKISRFESYGLVTVSSSISDSRSNPYNVVDPNGYGWWAPPLDIGHAYYQVLFERVYTLEKLVIKWKLKPPRLEIMILNKSGRWKVMLNEEPEEDIEMVLIPMEIRGVKIILLDMDKAAAGDDTVYGIKKIELHRPGSPLSLESCGA